MKYRKNYTCLKSTDQKSKADPSETLEQMYNISRLGCQTKANNSYNNNHEEASIEQNLFSTAKANRLQKRFPQQ